MNSYTFYITFNDNKKQWKQFGYVRSNAYQKALDQVRSSNMVVAAELAIIVTGEGYWIADPADPTEYDIRN